MNQQITCYLADDSAFSRKMITDICKELSVTVLKEFDSGDAMYKAMDASSYPDLIFLDINMPGRSGKELIDLLLDLNPDFIIIMISSIDNIQEINECLDLGAANYIQKSAGLSSMKEIIKATLKNNGLL